MSVKIQKGNTMANTCKRCLLRDISREDYINNLGKYIDAIAPEDRIDDEGYEGRLNICKECDLLNQGTCNACGCYVEIRAAVKKSGCPKKKWGKKHG